MAKKKEAPPPDLLAEEEKALTEVNLLAPAEGDSLFITAAEPLEEPQAPTMEDPAWHDYVMAQFEPDELDDQGRPYIHGLRRVARKLLGPILVSRAKVIQAPCYNNNVDEFSRLEPTTVEYTVIFLWQNSHEVEFTDVSDVYWGNTDQQVVRFPSATAATRSEGRCYRKALGLGRGVVTHDECTDVPAALAAANGKIQAVQIATIDNLCKRCNINVLTYIGKSKKQKFESIDDVPYGVALTMIEYLSKLQNNLETIPADLRGYDAKWRTR